MYLCRGRIIHRHDCDRRALLRGGKIFGFHTQFHFDLILGNDFNQRTAGRNDLSVLRVHFGDHARDSRVDAVIASRAGALQSCELCLGIARSFFRGTQVLICSQLQIETLLSLLQFLARSLRRVLCLLKLHLRARAQFNLDQRIVFLHELTRRDEDVAHARLEGD